jgi:hypothetical protein
MSLEKQGVREGEKCASVVGHFVYRFSPETRASLLPKQLADPHATGERGPEGLPLMSL